MCPVFNHGRVGSFTKSFAFVHRIVSHATIRRIAVEEEKADAPPLEDVESDDEVDDGDATADKARDRKADTLEYQGEEDEKMEIGETDQVEDDMEGTASCFKFLLLCGTLSLLCLCVAYCCICLFLLEICYTWICKTFMFKRNYY